MKPLSDALKIVTQEDVELAKKPPVRAVEQNPGNDADATNLMGLLGDIDGLKNEIHERMRRIEAVKQAKSVLLEDAERTSALNKRLAEIGKAMSVAHAGLKNVEIEKEAAEPVRMQTHEALIETELRQAVALPWPRTEEPLDLSEDAGVEPAAHLLEESASQPGHAPLSTEAVIAFESAFKRMEEAEQSRMQAWTQADEAAQEAKRLLQEATSQLNHAAGREEQAAQEFHSAQETLAAEFQSALERLETTEQSREAARIQAWAQADEAAQEARRLLEQATSQLNHALSREEQATQEFHSAQEALTAAQQAASQRIEEAELSWKKTDGAAIEAKRLLEQSTSELVQARKKEESIAANLQSVRQEFSTAYESASQRLQEAEEFWQKGDQAAKEAQQLSDQSTAELLQARKAEETAAADLLSARQELTTAYQFAAVAAQRRLDAVDSYQKSARLAVFAVAFSWVAMAWMGWFAFHAKIPVWVPGGVTVLIMIAVIVYSKRGSQES